MGEGKYFIHWLKKNVLPETLRKTESSQCIDKLDHYKGYLFSSFSESDLSYNRKTASCSFALSKTAGQSADCQNTKNYVLANVACKKPKSTVHFTSFMSTLLVYLRILLDRYGPGGIGLREKIVKSRSCPNLMYNDNKLQGNLSSGTSSSGYSTMSGEGVASSLGTFKNGVHGSLSAVSPELKYTMDQHSTPTHNRSDNEVGPSLQPSFLDIVHISEQFVQNWNQSSVIKESKEIETSQELSASKLTSASLPNFLSKSLEKNNTPSLKENEEQKFCSTFCSINGAATTTVYSINTAVAAMPTSSVLHSASSSEGSQNSTHLHRRSSPNETLKRVASFTDIQSSIMEFENASSSLIGNALPANFQDNTHQYTTEAITMTSKQQYRNNAFRPKALSVDNISQMTSQTSSYSNAWHVASCPSVIACAKKVMENKSLKNGSHRVHFAPMAEVIVYQCVSHVSSGESVSSASQRSKGNGCTRFLSKLKQAKTRVKRFTLSFLKTLCYIQRTSS